MLLFFSFFRRTLGCCTCGWFCATLHTRLRSKPRSIEYMVLFECRVFSWKLSSKIFPYFVHVTFLVTSHWVPIVCRALVLFTLFFVKSNWPTKWKEFFNQNMANSNAQFFGICAACCHPPLRYSWIDLSFWGLYLFSWHPSQQNY